VTGGRRLPPEVLAQIVAKTDGVPLFVEELTKNVLESGLLVEDGECFRLDGPLPPLAIPSTLQDSLMARLDRLSAVKEIVQIGAAIGREFSYAPRSRNWKTPRWCSAPASRPRGVTPSNTRWCRTPPTRAC
jgi:predicted ATPase